MLEITAVHRLHPPDLAISSIVENESVRGGVVAVGRVFVGHHQRALKQTEAAKGPLTLIVTGHVSPPTYKMQRSQGLLSWFVSGLVVRLLYLIRLVTVI